MRKDDKVQEEIHKGTRINTKRKDTGNTFDIEVKISILIENIRLKFTNCRFIYNAGLYFPIIVVLNTSPAIIYEQKNMFHVHILVREGPNNNSDEKGTKTAVCPTQLVLQTWSRQGKVPA